MGAGLLIRAPAKINLGLTILGQRPDGYHELETIMQQISLADYLHLEPNQGSGWRFRSTDPDLAGDDNLVCQAAALLAAEAGRPLTGVRLTLYKNIPVAAGLAGGSSDAAATLIGLNRYWQLGFSRSKLGQLAGRLGSDVPYCLEGGTAMAHGRGEKLTKLADLPFYWVVLALPNGVAVSTALSYRSFDRTLIGQPDLNPLLIAINAGERLALESWFSLDLTNTLESATISGLEQTAALKARLKDHGFKPLFSGSGPSLFMLINTLAEARNALFFLRAENCRYFLAWTLNGSEESWRYV